MRVCENEKTKVLNYLSMYCINYGNRIKGADLEKAINIKYKYISDHVLQLRIDGYPIFNKDNGYYFATYEDTDKMIDEIEKAHALIKRNAIKIRVAKEVIKNNSRRIIE